MHIYCKASIPFPYSLLLLIIIKTFFMSLSTKLFDYFVEKKSAIHFIPFQRSACHHRVTRRERFFLSGLHLMM